MKISAILPIAALLLDGCYTTSPDFKELNEHFTYKGRPVQPRAIEDLSRWISDEYPGPVAIDMDCTPDSNRYYGDVYRRGNIIGFYRRDGGVFGGAFFSYQHIGRLANGIHVLKIWDNGGGSGTYESLLLVKFITQDAYDDNGHRSQRTVIQQVGQIPLGDRVNAEVKIEGNSVKWTVEGGSPVNVRFD